MLVVTMIWHDKKPSPSELHILSQLHCCNPSNDTTFHHHQNQQQYEELMKSCGIRNCNRTAFRRHHHHNKLEHPSHTLVFGPTLPAGSIWYHYRKTTVLMVKITVNNCTQNSDMMKTISITVQRPLSSILQPTYSSKTFAAELRWQPN